jgi:hypothetical protein
LPRAVVEKYVEQGLLGRIEVPIHHAMTSYGIVTRKNEVPSQAMAEFSAVLRSVAAGSAFA